MFDLKIQSTNQPADDFVSCGKIGCSLNLMNSPFVFNIVAISWYREVGFFHGMRQLKYNAEHETGEKGDGEETDQPVEPTYHDYWNDNHDRVIKNFRTPEGEVLQG
jgi:hypothetical protein